MYFLFFRVALITSILLNISDGFVTQKNKYRGCYEYDSRNSLLTEHKENLDKSISPQLCVEKCAAEMFPFAGVLKQECYCGNHVPSDIIKRNNLECNIPCLGDKKFKCGGGENKISVYETGVYFSELITSRIYIGCYADNPNRTFSTNVRNYPSDNSPEKCHKTCYNSDHKYFGLELGVECFCGDLLPKQDELRNEGCYFECPGILKKNCGGGWRISLYATGI